MNSNDAIQEDKNANEKKQHIGGEAKIEIANRLRNKNLVGKIMGEG